MVLDEINKGRIIEMSSFGMIHRDIVSKICVEKIPLLIF